VAWTLPPAARRSTPALARDARVPLLSNCVPPPISLLPNFQQGVGHGHHRRSHPEYRDEAIAAFEAAEETVHATEDGCLLYALHESPDGKFVMIEKYADQAAVDAHVAGAGLAALIKALEGKLAAPMDVQILTPHPAGSAEKGAL
jgi:quinol monooxygenase YgiN